MKVLEKKPFKVYECGLCKSKLEAEVSDVRGCNSYYWIACPVCGSHKVLSDKEVPPKVVKYESSAWD